MFLLPIEEDNPSTRSRPYAVWMLVLTNVVVFIATLALGSEDTLRTYGFLPESPSVQRAMASMFLHAGFLHLFSNMFFLVMFGDNVEDMTGKLKFLLGYFLAGAVAMWTHTLTTHHPHVALIGASGAVSGVMGMYLVLHPRASFHTHVSLLHLRVGGFRPAAVVAVGAWCGQQLILALLSSWARTPILGVAFWAHVGGFGAGIVLGFVLGRLKLGGPDSMHISPRIWSQSDS